MTQKLSFKGTKLVLSTVGVLENKPVASVSH